MADLGYHAVGANSFTTQQQIQAMRFVAPASGTISQVFVYLTPGSGTGEVTAFVGDAGTPNSNTIGSQLLSYSSTATSVSGAAGWFACNLDVPVPVLSGQTYLLAFAFRTLTGTAVGGKYDTVPTGDHWFSGSAQSYFWNQPPNPFRSPNFDTITLSVYAPISASRAGNFLFGGGIPAPSASPSLASGYVQPFSPLPILDKFISGQDVKDPKLYFDGTTYHMFYDIGAGGVSGAHDVCYASAPNIAGPFTDSGVIISHSNAAFTAVVGSTGFLAASEPVPDGSGGWIMYVNAVDSYSPVALGGIWKCTASSLAGPWTVGAQALAASGAPSNVPTDNHGPVFWNSQYVMPFEMYTSGVNRTRFATASSVAGPWTVSASGPNLTGFDSPQLVVEGSNLYLIATPGNTTLRVYQMSTDLATATSVNTTFGQAPVGQQGNPFWGAHSLIKVGSVYMIAWIGVNTSSTDLSRWKIYTGYVK